MHLYIRTVDSTAFGDSLEIVGGELPVRVYGQDAADVRQRYQRLLTISEEDAQTFLHAWYVNATLPKPVEIKRQTPRTEYYPTWEPAKRSAHFDPEFAKLWAAEVTKRLSEIRTKLIHEELAELNTGSMQPGEIRIVEV